MKGVGFSARFDKKRNRARHKPSRSLRTYSFLVTLALLALIVGGSYYSTLPTVEHIPVNFQFQSSGWMAFVPQTSQYVSFIDYHEAYMVSGNPLLFGAHAILQFYQISLDIPVQSVLFDLDIQLPPSSFNSAAVSGSVIKIRNDTMRILLDTMVKMNLTKTTYDGYPLYRLLLINPTSDPKLINAYTAIVDYSVLVVSTDQTFGRYAVETILDQYSSRTQNLFDKQEVRCGIYASGASDRPFIGLFVGTFSSQFNNTRMIVKSIVSDVTGIRVTRSVLFANSDLAIDAIGQAHRVYRDANRYSVLDQWLVITYNYALEKLRGELTGI
jgi:hypothetical protein